MVQLTRRRVGRLEPTQVEPLQGSTLSTVGSQPLPQMIDQCESARQRQTFQFSINYGRQNFYSTAPGDILFTNYLSFFKATLSFIYLVTSSTFKVRCNWKETLFLTKKSRSRNKSRIKQTFEQWGSITHQMALPIPSISCFIY